MDKQRLALSLIRPSISSKLQDRTFVLTLLGILLGFVLFNAGKISGNDYLEFLKWAIGIWAAAEKLKDGLIGSAAVKEGSKTTAAAGDVTEVNNELS